MVTLVLLQLHIVYYVVWEFCAFGIFVTKVLNFL